MNNKILIGSIGIIFLLVLMSFTSVVSAQTTKRTINVRMLQQIKTFVKNTEWFPGQILGTLFVAFLTLLWYLTKWLISPHN